MLQLHPDAAVANMGCTLDELAPIYGPYRCTCPGPCAGCGITTPPRASRHPPTTVPCGWCQTSMTPSIGQQGALTKGQAIYCSPRCRHAVEIEYASRCARAAFLADGITELQCRWCGTVTPLDQIDRRRLSRYRRTQRFYCPDRPCSAAAKQHPRRSFLTHGAPHV